MRARSVSGRTLPTLCCCMPTVLMVASQGLTAIRKRCWVDFNDGNRSRKKYENNQKRPIDHWNFGYQHRNTGFTLESNSSASQRGEFKSPWWQRGDSFISSNPSRPHTRPELAQGGQPAGSPFLLNASALTGLHLCSVQTAGNAP